MEIYSITEMRSVYVVDTDSITDNIPSCNILLCCKGKRTNVVHLLLMGRGEQIFMGETNIRSLGEQILGGTNIL